jgi:hypothetical protein
MYFIICNIVMLTTFCGFDPEGWKEMKCRRSNTLLLLLPLLLPLLLLLLLQGAAESAWLLSSAALCCQKDTMLFGVTTVPVWPLKTLQCAAACSY